MYFCCYQALGIKNKAYKAKEHHFITIYGVHHEIFPHFECPKPQTNFLKSVLNKDNP